MPAEHRTVRATLGRRQLLGALALTLLVPGALGVGRAHLRGTRACPDVDRAAAPCRYRRYRTVSRWPSSTAASPTTRVARTLTAPQLLTPASTGTAQLSTLPTLALAPRHTPYTLAELHALVPAAFSDVPVAPGALLLKAHLEVPVGAALVIDTQTPDVRLPSSPSAFAAIISRGTTTVAGTAQTPVRISTWDPQQQAPDGVSTDGRSFVLQIGGRMDVDHGRFEYLGFGTGTSSGVAWRGDAPEVAGTTPDTGWIKAQGTVTNSLFAHNHFGAYTHQAQGMRWSGNTFSDNVEYGFDPHDFSNDFVVESNTAHHNGKHGFIFSRGCDGNVLRGNTAYANAGHGFMIDDGRSVDERDGRGPDRPLERQPRHRQPRLRQRRQRRRDRGRHRQRRVGQPPVAQRHRGARQVRCHGLRHRQRDRRQHPLRGARARPGSPGGDRRQPHLRVVGGGQPRRGEQRDAGGEPVDRRLDTTGDRRGGPARPVVDRPGGPVPALESGAGAVGADPGRTAAGRAVAVRARAPAPGCGDGWRRHDQAAQEVGAASRGAAGRAGPAAHRLRHRAPPETRRETMRPAGHRRSPDCPGPPTCPRPIRSAARRRPSR